MNTQELIDVMIPAVDKFGGFPAPVKFVIDGDMIIHIHEKTVLAEDKDADCTISMSMETMKQIIAGDADPMGAVMDGDIEVDGDSSIAISVQGLF